jgi:hypothetical protein
MLLPKIPKKKVATWSLNLRHVLMLPRYVVIKRNHTEIYPGGQIQIPKKVGPDLVCSFSGPRAFLFPWRFKSAKTRAPKELRFGLFVVDPSQLQNRLKSSSALNRATRLVS